MPKEPTRNLTINIDTDLYATAQRLALRESVQADRRISLAEWVREAIRQRVERER